MRRGERLNVLPLFPEKAWIQKQVNHYLLFPPGKVVSGFFTWFFWKQFLYFKLGICQGFCIYPFQLWKRLSCFVTLWNCRIECHFSRACLFVYWVQKYISYHNRQLQNVMWLKFAEHKHIFGISALSWKCATKADRKFKVSTRKKSTYGFHKRPFTSPTEHL